MPDEQEAPERGDEVTVETENDDFATRQLCPDGGCVGVLAADGRCKVCGAVAGERSVDWRAGGAADAARAEAAETTSSLGLLEMEEGFADDRQLCPDGSCIGVLGADGRCRVCGRGADPL